MTGGGSADSGPVQAEDSCDWCYRASTDASRAESKQLGLVAEYTYACETCLAAKVYLTEPPQDWPEDLAWPFLASETERG